MSYSWIFSIETAGVKAPVDQYIHSADKTVTVLEQFHTINYISSEHH